jgi:hypothetical protein
MRYSHLWGAIGLFLLGSSSAMAGVVVTSTYTKLDTKETSPSTLYIDNDRVKLVSQDVTVIFRADTNRMWIIQPKDNTYTEMTAEAMQQMGGQLAGAQAQLGAAQAQLQASLAQMPPQQRAMMEQMLAGRGLGAPPGAGGPPAPPQISFVKTGGGKAVAGIRCDTYSKSMNGQKQSDVCVAPVSSAGLTAGDVQVFERLAQFVQPIASSPMVPRMGYLDWNEMTKAIGFAGFPLESVIYIGGQPNLQQTVNKIERTTIPAGTYDLPAGLSKRELPGLR